MAMKKGEQMQCIFCLQIPGAPPCAATHVHVYKGWLKQPWSTFLMTGK